MRGAAVVLLAAIAAGCREEDVQPCFLDFELEPEPEPLYTAPTECDPFVLPQTAALIQPPVVVARTADGEVYAIDRLDYGYDRPGVDDLLVRSTTWRRTSSRE